MYLIHHPCRLLVAGGARVAGAQVMASGPKCLCVTSGCLHKCCHFLCLLLCEAGWDRLAEPSFDIQNLAQADLLNWVRTNWAAQNRAQSHGGAWREEQKKMSSEGGRGTYTREEPGSMGRREEVRLESSERTRSLSEPHKLPACLATGPPASHLYPKPESCMGMSWRKFYLVSLNWEVLIW